MTRDHVLKQEIHKPPHLGLLQAFDFGKEFTVEEEILLSSNRVHTHKWVHGVDGVFTD